MPEVEVTQVIRRTVDDVWEFSLAPDNEPQWLTHAVERRLLTPPPVGVGSRVLAVDRWLGHRSRAVREIVEVEPLRRWSARTVEGFPPVELTVVCRKVGRDTRLTLVLDVPMTDRWEALAAPALTAILRRELKTDISRLKSLLEVEE